MARIYYEDGSRIFPATRTRQDCVEMYRRRRSANEAPAQRHESFMHDIPTLLLLALTVGAWSANAHAYEEGPENQPNPPPPAADKPSHEAAEGDDSDHRPVRIGALGGVGFPRPLEVEAMIKLGDYVGLGAEYGVMPKLSVDGVDSKMCSLAGDLKLGFFHFAEFFSSG
jgi:hypothetical protein